MGKGQQTTEEDQQLTLDGLPAPSGNCLKVALLAVADTKWTM